ncbi:zinc finger, AN1-type domain [Lunasporangiospora selenospora]|uniref:Zinc finger, AN1-type domain n=1 Tax=Lunasporangiospora selenospora TaxID=979761 RepID=A0A9P6FR85_9FUNG|nr:zinc finger, AN1-type domain [Lunasporangiospora selenospora]
MATVVRQAMAPRKELMNYNNRPAIWKNGHKATFERPPQINRFLGKQLISLIIFIVESQDHWKLEGHVCPNQEAAALQDQRVPICPLCNKPVPIKKGEDPNVRMEQHISAGCPEPATTTSKPIYTNSCNFKPCKNRSAIPVICQKCRLNYCLKHRLEGDHACPSLQKKNGQSAPPPPKKSLGGQNSKQGSSSTNQPFANGQSARSAKAAAAASNRATTSSTSSNSRNKDKEKCVIS